MPAFNRHWNHEMSLSASADVVWGETVGVGIPVGEAEVTASSASSPQLFSPHDTSLLPLSRAYAAPEVTESWTTVPDPTFTVTGVGDWARVKLPWPSWP